MCIGKLFNPLTWRGRRFNLFTMHTTTHCMSPNVGRYFVNSMNWITMYTHNAWFDFSEFMKLEFLLLIFVTSENDYKNPFVAHLHLTSEFICRSWVFVLCNVPISAYASTMFKRYVKYTTLCVKQNDSYFKIFVFTIWYLREKYGEML